MRAGFGTISVPGKRTEVTAPAWESMASRFRSATITVTTD
jgi:hypothetical protein